MVNKRFWLVILVMVLVFGMMIVGCEEEPEEKNFESEIEKYSVNGHSYQIIDRGMSWTDAKNYCEVNGGYLVTITDANEQAFVEIFLQSEGNRNVYWMGGFRDNGWKWITGEPFEYTNWNTEQPDNYGGQDKLTIYRNDIRIYFKNKWDDVANNGKVYDEKFFGFDNFGFICEWD